MTILGRYVIREMLGPFLFGLTAFTILFFSVETLMGVARMIVESKAGPQIIGEYLLNRLPQVVVYTCPMAMLLAGLLAFGRLSGESELTALKAAGVSFTRVAFPGLVFCFTVSLILAWVNDEIVPKTMKRSFDIVMSTQKFDPFRTALLTVPRQLANGQEQMVYVHKLNLESQEMKGVFIHYFEHNKRRREVYADEAKWDGRVWQLKGMRMVEYDEKQDHQYEIETTDAWTPMQPGDSPPSPEALAKREFRPEELSRRELRERLEQLPELARGDDESKRKRRRFEVMYHQKMALPWTSLVFGLFAIPLGVRPHRSSRSMGLGLSLLFILIYYVLMTVGMVLGETGSLPPEAGAWLPNLVFGCMGFLLLMEASRR